MNLLNTAAVIALASAGLTAQTPGQSYTERFQAIQPELERLIASMDYKEAIEKIEAILPSTTPAFMKNPENPDVGMNSYQELLAIQSFHVYLGRAYVMFGDTEKAISNFKKAEEIAKLNAVEVEAMLTPLIEQWSAAVEFSKQQLVQREGVANAQEQLETRKKEIESKRRQNNNDKQILAQIAENELKIQEYINNIPVWEANLERAPVAIEQLNGMINTAKEDITKFSPAIKGLEEDLQAEKDLIASRFNGDIPRYVTSVAETKENLDSLQSQADKVKFLNRLLFLDPKNVAAQKQLDIALGRATPEPEPAPRPAPRRQPARR